jgi:hypothetical protein
VGLLLCGMKPARLLNAPGSPGTVAFFLTYVATSKYICYLAFRSRVVAFRSLKPNPQKIHSHSTPTGSSRPLVTRNFRSRSVTPNNQT